MAGFTLIELLVVLALAALVIALATPRLHRALPGLELAATAEELAAALGETRGRALAAGRPRALLLDIDDGIYRIDSGPVRRLPDGVRVDAVAATEALEEENSRIRFRFFPDGTAEGGRITLSRGGRAFAIEIDWLTGRVLVSEIEPENG